MQWNFLTMSQLHLLKLCVGVDSIEDLIAWRSNRNPDWAKVPSRHVTRMWPKREAELLAGGSLYWVIKGAIQARQTIVGLQEVIGEDGIRRCAILLDPQLIRTSNAVRRPFQGWRYLQAEDAPADLSADRPHEDSLPPELSLALAEIGVR
jgi:hypothetical protein